MKTFIITDSWDVTSDIVVHRLGDDVFRLNTDLIRDYKIEWLETGFQIWDPTGRSLMLCEIGSVYWRKPFSSQLYDDISSPDYFFYSECRYLIRELYNVATSSGAFALVEAGAERRLGKIYQLLIAKHHFRVPKWRVTLGYEYSAPAGTIAKSLSGEQVDIDNAFDTTRIDEKTLDPSYVWLTQEAIDKTSDVTDCYVEGKLFA